MIIVYISAMRIQIQYRFQDTLLMNLNPKSDEINNNYLEGIETKSTQDADVKITFY